MTRAISVGIMWNLQIARKTALGQGSIANFFRMQNRLCLCGLQLQYAVFAAEVVDRGLR